MSVALCCCFARQAEPAEPKVVDASESTVPKAKCASKARAKPKKSEVSKCAKSAPKPKEAPKPKGKGKPQPKPKAKVVKEDNYNRVYSRVYRRMLAGGSTKEDAAAEARSQADPWSKARAKAKA